MTIREPSEEQSHPMTSLSTKIDKDAFRLMFNAVMGKSDSRLKLFYKNILIRPVDLEELNRRLVSKFSTLPIVGNVVSISINFRNHEIEEIGTWENFQKYDWTTNREIESILIKWDFSIQLPQKEKPQNHTLSVKICSKPPMLELMQAAFSSDSTSVDEIEQKFASVVCRIDFMNTLLGDELLNLVSNWVDSCLIKTVEIRTVRFLRKMHKSLYTIIRYSFPLLLFTFSFFIGFRYYQSLDPLTSLTTKNLFFGFSWLFVTFALTQVFNRLGITLAEFTLDQVFSIGRFPPFEFTNGDKNMQTILLAENQHSIRRSIAAIAFSLILDFASAYLFYLIVK